MVSSHIKSRCSPNNLSIPLTSGVAEVEKHSTLPFYAAAGGFFAWSQNYRLRGALVLALALRAYPWHKDLLPLSKQSFVVAAALYGTWALLVGLTIIAFFE